MIVKLAEKRGFCFGVEDAIEIAEKAIDEHGAGNVVALGPVIHNRQVVERLESAGLRQSGRLEELEPGANVLIRSHGATPDVLQQAEKKRLNVIDATCVLVKKAQEVVKRLHQEGYRVVMIGDRNHPEVRGVIAYAPDVVVIDHVEDVARELPHKEKLGIVAQTTHAPEHVAQIIAAIVKRPYVELRIVNTLCLEVIRRQQAAVKLAGEVDVMFVLGGRHSANTQEMARLCREAGVDTYHLETWADFDPSMVEGKSIAGIAAGASTPDWVINDFADRLREV
ncbi:MAG: 4-hydroxy-3-methylbut-2-enyl diphosphate reductase [Phycisphaerales bacterium]|nr:MAG: 4-hydroxy-3-methylbut-2-enyl diphosphate reductase [Phycisphaerales bacterium]